MHKNKSALELLKPFVRATFENGTQLDLLEIMHADSDCPWTVEKLSASLCEKDQVIQHALMHLESRGLLKQIGHQEFCFHPNTALSGALVNLLILQLKSRRLQIVRLIYDDN
ncbi:MAG: hypothetical protein C0507_11310 [Cyanobacteria bacterium PR.3.49]|nr:hypothetical protein [Cyanobacteria bacterium PR.3.49]